MPRKQGSGFVNPLLLFSSFVLFVSFLPSVHNILSRFLPHQSTTHERRNTESSSSNSKNSNPGTQSNSFPNRSPSQQWTHPPICTSPLPDLDAPLCVYTLSTFNNNTGISLFTTPIHASSFLNLPIFSSPTPLPQPHAPYNLTAHPSKGISLHAAEPISRLSPILTTHPVFIMHPSPTLNTTTREHYIRIAISQLPPSTQASFYNLSTIYHQPSIRASDIIKANSFELDLPPYSFMHLAVFPAPSRINHDCAPNAMYNIDSDFLTHYVLATRDIGRGEEVSVAYLNVLQDVAARGRMLKTGWGFECRCRRCERERNGSDDGSRKGEGEERDREGEGDALYEIRRLDGEIKSLIRQHINRKPDSHRSTTDININTNTNTDTDTNSDADNELPPPPPPPPPPRQPPPHNDQTPLHPLTETIHTYLSLFPRFSLEGYSDEAYKLAAVATHFVLNQKHQAREYASIAAEVQEMRVGRKHADVGFWRALGSGDEDGDSQQHADMKWKEALEKRMNGK